MLTHCMRECVPPLASEQPTTQFATVVSVLYGKIAVAQVSICRQYISRLRASKPRVFLSPNYESYYAFETSHLDSKLRLGESQPCNFLGFLTQTFIAHSPFKNVFRFALFIGILDYDWQCGRVPVVQRRASLYRLFPHATVSYNYGFVTSGWYSGFIDQLIDSGFIDQLIDSGFKCFQIVTVSGPETGKLIEWANTSWYFNFWIRQDNCSTPSE